MEGYQVRSDGLLCVERKGIGSLLFLADADPSGIVLDENVIIRPGFVEVEDERIKDIPALVSLCHISRSSISSIQKLFHQRRVQIVDYSAESHCLRFIVPHFSSYDIRSFLLDDDDDDDEDDDIIPPISSTRISYDEEEDEEDASNSRNSFSFRDDDDVTESVSDEEKFPHRGYGLELSETETEESEEDEDAPLHSHGWEDEESEGSEEDGEDLFGSNVPFTNGQLLGYMPIQPPANSVSLFEEEEEEEDEESENDGEEATQDQENRSSADEDMVEKTEVMKSVFFPFPHDNAEEPKESPSQDDDMIESEPTLATPHSFTRKPISPFLHTPVRKEEQETIHTPTNNTLFPEELPFPPKKRFQMGGDSLDSFKGFKKPERAPVEYDALFYRRSVPLDASITRDLISVNNPPSNDFALTLGRSFRVGFGPGDLIVTPSSSDLLGTLHIDHIAGVAFGANSEEPQMTYESQLRAHLESNPFRHESDSFTFVPSFGENLQQDEITNHAKHAIKKMSRVTTEQMRQKKSSTESKKPKNDSHDLIEHSTRVWKLIDALWGQIESATVDGKHFFPCEPDLFQTQETDVLIRCRRSLSEWGQEALREAILVYQEKLDRHKSAHHLADSLMNLLSGRQLRKSIDLAISNNQFRLATVVSQACNLQMREQMKQQLTHWQSLLAHENSAFSHSNEFIEPSLACLYHLLAGEIEESYCKPAGFDWLRCFFCFFWYGHQSNSEPYVDSALHAYENSNLFQLFPPQFTKQNISGDILYYLLSYFAKGEVDIWDVVNPRGYSSYYLEYSTSWFVFTLLSALLQRPYHTDKTVYLQDVQNFEFRLYQMTLSFASQLEMLGQFQWSVYVLLHLPDKELRLRAVQNVLDRNAMIWEDGVSTELRSGLNPQKIENFLIQQLHIPVEMLYKAKACAASYKQDHVRCLEYLLAAGERNEAHSVFVELVGPQAVLQFHTESKSFLHENYAIVPHLLEQLRTVMNNEEGAYRIYDDYFASFFGNPGDNLSKVIELVRSRLLEIKKYKNKDIARFQLERLCLSDIPSTFAEQKDQNGTISELALGNNHIPMPSANQFSYFDYITNSSLTPR